MSSQSDCLACLDEFFAHNPLDVKENDENTLHIVIHIVIPFLPILVFVKFDFSTKKMVTLSVS